MSIQEVTSLTSRVAPATIEALFRKSGAERWAVARDDFAAVVEAGIDSAFSGAPPAGRELERHLAGLHLEDLALGCACAHGHEAAWNHFVLEYRPTLYRAADALDPAGGARELADSLYADLFGLSDATDRRSLFRYFHGRSSLATWLRAVLAQRHIDALRARRRVEPLTEGDSATTQIAAPPPDPDRPRLVSLVIQALQLAIEGLIPRDRLRLRSYYVSQLTLAQIGRITGEHEATVSRHLSRTRRILRETVERHLREASHLSVAQIGRALELALDDPGGMDLQQVMDERKDAPRDRSN
jgi:RNA polymerase sigma-70 factor (ECF subfamily)